MDQKFPNFVPPTQVAFRPDGATTLHLRKCRIIVEIDGKRKEHTFEQSDITLGSSEDNTVTVADDTVSRNHCRIYQAGSSYLVQDLSSTNGTFVNQVRVKEAYLKPGCTIELGNTRIQFQSFDEEVHINPLSDERFGDIIGASRDMRAIFGILEKISPSDATVIIEGETGTGKEVVANTIHKKSRRAEKPFIVFDCSAVPANLIESELFGHEKGSFTGAIMARPGLFELAHGGTVFLDELGELTSDLQPKLLRVLETREVRRVGGTRPMKVDVRVIAATNRSLEEEVRAGRFREDLFYRLSVVRLSLPPLRERREDIQLLARHFLNTGRFNRGDDGQRKVQTIGREVMEALRGYDWPGNVRELLNIMERAVSFADSDTITLADLPANLAESDHMQRLQTLGARITNQGRQTVDELGNFKHAKEKWVSSFERDYIVRLLEKHGFNISHAARDAEIDRKYFRKLMKKYGIENPKNADTSEAD
ncbi:MAG: sigma 54-interacting transcriptional regulator [Myxococcota bacterium]|nr:sigma 54-interacting transcriptional regulator [Myxococcota bacterium]